MLKLKTLNEITGCFQFSYGSSQKSRTRKKPQHDEQQILGRDLRPSTPVSSHLRQWPFATPTPQTLPYLQLSESQ